MAETQETPEKKPATAAKTASAKAPAKKAPAKAATKAPAKTAAKAPAKASAAKAKAPAKTAAKPAAKAPAKTASAKPAAKKPAAAKPAASKTAGSAAAAKPAASAKSPAKKPAAKAQSEDVKVTYLHDLRPAPGSNKPKTRVGRGEASKGKTAGRGTKGTKARYQVPVNFEGGQMPLHMRLPKLRGFKNPFHVEYQVVNLDRLSQMFPEGGTLSVEELVAKGLVRKGEKVKVLGTGELTAKFDLTVDAWSESAKTKVEAKGGSLTAR